MSISTIRSSTHTANRNRRRPPNQTYYSHECPVCHCLYTTQRKKSRHCGQAGCARIVNLEEQIAARESA